MPLEDLIKEATHTFSARMQEAVEALAEQLAQAAAADRAAAEARASETLAERLAEARATASAEIERAVTEGVERAREEVEEAALARIEEARAEAKRAADAHVEERLAEAQKAADTRVEATLADAQKAAGTRLEAELAEARQAADARVEAAVAEARQAADARVEAAVADARTAAAVQVDEAHKSAEAELARVRSEAEASVELARARAATEAEAAAASAVTNVVAGERQHQLACSERLLEVIRRLDTASSLTDVLGTLADGAAAEAPRVAVLTLHGDRVRGWRFKGFSPEPDTVDLDLADAGVVGRAVRAREAAFAEPAAPGHSEPAGPPFAALPPDRSGLAMPLVVGGATVAVVYADDVTDVEQPKPAAWPESVEILGRHAAVRLENLTAIRTAQAFGLSHRPRESTAGAPGAAPVSSGASDEDEGARRYARLLVSEIKLYNESAVRAGREKRDLGERLRAEISRARQLYEGRVSSAARARHDHFHEELVQTLAGGDAALLGRPSDALA